MENIELTVRIQPTGDEVSLVLEPYTSGKEIKKALIAEEVAPSSNSDGSPIIYKLISKSSNLEISDNKTLDDLGIREGETLFMIPEIAAG